jgi:hypothetical protein
MPKATAKQLQREIASGSGIDRVMDALSQVKVRQVFKGCEEK